MAIEFLEGEGQGTVPANPGLTARSGAVAQAGPVENPTTQTFLGIMGAADYLPYRPTTPTGPYATGYLGRQIKRVEEYRRATGQAFNGLPGGQFYVFTNYSDKATTSYQTLDSMMSEFEAMPNKGKKNLAKLLAMAGYLAGGSTLEETVEDSTLMEVTEAYAGLLAEAAQRFANGENVTPDELLERNIRYNMSQVGLEADGAFNHKGALKWYDKAIGKTGEPRTEVQVNKSIDLFSAQDARGLARQTMQQVLGRDPTEDEYEDFVTALNTSARANPTITRTRTRYDAEGNVVSSVSRSRGGLGSAGVNQTLQDEAESTPGWAEWQAIGTYLPEVFNALGATVPGA